jgi:ribosomal protein L11 methyltransferase
VIRLAVRLGRADAAAALRELLVFSPAGVEEIDGDGDSVEYVLYGAPDEMPDRRTLERALGATLLELTASEIADDWDTRWRTFHRPAEISGTLYVRPPWCAPAPDPSLIDLVIEPAQAFGTGAHATTRLCLELLVELTAAGEARGALLDVGCGSGVLAIAAAKLGFAPVVGVDHEPESVTATLENAAANGVEVASLLADLREDPLPHASVITANLLAPLLALLAGRLEEPPELLIASGLLTEQSSAVADAFAAHHGMHERARRHSGEWSALLLETAPPRRILKPT